MPINKKRYIIYFFTFFFLGNLLYYYKNNAVINRIITSHEEKGREVNDLDNHKIRVKISGCIKKPGVYALSQGSTLGDLIKHGKGVLDSADRNSLNYGLLLSDGCEYVVGYRKLKTGEYININGASQKELERIPHMRIAMVKAIIDYRNQYKRFDTIEEIKDIEGIGEKRFEQIRNYIRVGE